LTNSALSEMSPEFRHPCCINSQSAREGGNPTRRKVRSQDPPDDRKDITITVYESTSQSYAIEELPGCVQVNAPSLKLIQVNEGHERVDSVPDRSETGVV